MSEDDKKKVDTTSRGRGHRALKGTWKNRAVKTAKGKGVVSDK